MLISKHPEPCVPPTCALLSWCVLPHLQEIEITSSLIQFVAQKIQGGAETGAVMLSIDRMHPLTLHGATS